MDKEKIIACLAEVIEKEAAELKGLSPDTELAELDLGSLKFIQFIVLLEETFGIEIYDSDLLFTNFDTLEKLFQTLRKYFEPNTALKKCIILDCDNVLWEGVAGEEPVRINENIRRFQDTLIRLHTSGVLVCLCSKNTQANIDGAFSELNMPLKKEHIILEKTNCNNKVESIKEISYELNLISDSFVFIDDSDYELGLIESMLPTIETVKADYSNLSFIEYAASLFITDGMNDIDRTKLYREQKEREKLKHTYNSVEEYNNSLDTHIICRKAGIDESGRIAELSQRTNQFNLSVARYTEEEIMAFIADKDYAVLSLSAADKYGDIGIVSAAVIRMENDKAVIESFMLSCRVFGRGFETAMLNYLKEICANKKLAGIYIEMEQNKLYKNFYADNGVEYYGC